MIGSKLFPSVSISQVIRLGSKYIGCKLPSDIYEVVYFLVRSKSSWCSKKDSFCNTRCSYEGMGFVFTTVANFGSRKVWDWNRQNLRSFTTLCKPWCFNMKVFVNVYTSLITFDLFSLGKPWQIFCFYLFLEITFSYFKPLIFIFPFSASKFVVVSVSLDLLSGSSNYIIFIA